MFLQPLSLSWRTLVTFGVGRTHNLQKAQQVIKDKNIFPSWSPGTMWDLSLSLYNSEVNKSIVSFSLFMSFRSNQVCVYLHTQVDDYILQQTQVLWVTDGKTRQVKLAALHSWNCSTRSPSTARWRMCTAAAAQKCGLRKRVQRTDDATKNIRFHCFTIQSLIFSKVSDKIIGHQVGFCCFWYCIYRTIGCT